MQETWLKQDAAHRDLVIYMLGWAANPNAVRHIDPPGCDVLVCYDHREMAELEPQRFAHYRRIYLFAWSFGIWVSEQSCLKLPIYKAIALNGTPFPVSERYGMRLRVVLRSMRAIAKAGGNSFAANNTEDGRYMPSGPYPELSIAEKIDELTLLAERSKEETPSQIRWDVAYIADKDEMFPPARMRDYWNPLGLGTNMDSYHYPFTDPDIVLRHISND